MRNCVNFEVKFVPAGTGSTVWDDPNAEQVVNRFMPPRQGHKPTMAVVHLGDTRPTPGVLRSVVQTVAENVNAGRYGNCSFFVCSEDENTRCVIEDIANSQNIAMFLCSSPSELDVAEPLGRMTVNDFETLTFVYHVGGTVDAGELADRIEISKNAAGNRLVALQKKGLVQRVMRPHPIGDLFIDPRAYANATFGDGNGLKSDPVVPNRSTLEAMADARNGDVRPISSIGDLIAELDENDD